MRIILITYLITCFSISMLRAGGEVGNGGGIAENNIIFAYNNIDEYIKHCLSLTSCTSSEDERSILLDILNGMDEEYANRDQLQFLSGRKYPHIFRDQFDHERFAVTGNLPGSNIYINSDMFYESDFGKVTYITILQAVSMLTHELGHHHGIKDERFLNNLGANVAKSMSANIIHVPLGPKAKNIVAKVIKINDPAVNFAFDNIMLSDGNKHFDLSSTVEMLITCPVRRSESLDLVGVSIWQPHWSSYQSPTPYLTGDIILYCKSLSTDEIFIFSGSGFSLFPKLYKDNRNKILIRSIQFKYISCLSNQSGCIARKGRYMSYLQKISKQFNFNIGGKL